MDGTQKRELVLNTILVMIYASLLFLLGAWYAVHQLG